MNTQDIFIGFDQLTPNGVLHESAQADVKSGARFTSERTGQTNASDSFWGSVAGAVTAGTLVLAIGLGSSWAVHRAPPEPPSAPTSAVAQHTLDARAGGWAARLYQAVRAAAPQLATPPLVSIEEDIATIEVGLPHARIGVLVAATRENSGWYMARERSDGSLERGSGALEDVDVEFLVRSAVDATSVG